MNYPLARWAAHHSLICFFADGVSAWAEIPRRPRQATTAAEYRCPTPKHRHHLRPSGFRQLRHRLGVWCCRGLANFIGDAIHHRVGIFVDKRQIGQFRAPRSDGEGDPLHRRHDFARRSLLRSRLDGVAVGIHQVHG